MGSQRIFSFTFTFQGCFSAKIELSVVTDVAQPAKLIVLPVWPSAEIICRAPEQKELLGLMKRSESNVGGWEIVGWLYGRVAVPPRATGHWWGGRMENTPVLGFQRSWTLLRVKGTTASMDPEDTGDSHGGGSLGCFFYLLGTMKVCWILQWFPER